MATWTFFDFVNANGVSPFAQWLKKQPIAVQAAIDARILQMSAMPQWRAGWVSFYRGYNKLIELRIPHNKVQYRPLGCYGPDRHEFTFLAGAIEKNSKIPRSILESAMQRMSLIQDRRYVYEHQFI